MKTNPNDSVVGLRRYDYKERSLINDPLTKREHFAGIAMQALLSDLDTIRWFEHEIPQKAVMFADQLISELNRAKETPPINLNHDPEDSRS